MKIPRKVAVSLIIATLALVGVIALLSWSHTSQYTTASLRPGLSTTGDISTDNCPTWPQCLTTDRMTFPGCDCQPSFNNCSNEPPVCPPPLSLEVTGYTGAIPPACIYNCRLITVETSKPIKPIATISPTIPSPAPTIFLGPPLIDPTEPLQHEPSTEPAAPGAAQRTSWFTRITNWIVALPFWF